MKLAPTDHDWRRPNANRKTTWVCFRCGCMRKSEKQPPANMLVVLEAHYGKQRSVRGPRSPSENVWSCGELQIQQVHES